MHLYQYLPGKFKATASATPKKLDALDLTQSTKSSLLTPKQHNLSGKTQHRDDPSKPQQDFKSNAGFDHAPRIPDMDVPNQKVNDCLPVDVGKDFSEETVVSDVTTPTTLTYPKIGSGYSDAISVASDITTPTVMPGAPESEVLQPAVYMSSLLDEAPPSSRNARAKGASRFEERRITFEQKVKESNKSHRSRNGKKKEKRISVLNSEKDLHSRLDQLRMKSIEGIGPSNSPKSPRSPPHRGTYIAASCPHRFNAPNEQATSPKTSKKMEDAVWSTLQQLMEKQFGEDFEGVENRTPKRRSSRSTSPNSKVHRSRMRNNRSMMITKSS